MRRLRLWTPMLVALAAILAGCSACRPPPLASAPGIAAQTLIPQLR